MEFHLSLAVPALQPSVDFFTNVLGAHVAHVDPSGYVNLEIAGVQLTLNEIPGAHDRDPELHFGVNLDLDGFHALVARARSVAPECIEQPPRVVDAGTANERMKLFLRCPAGYLIEVKGRAAA